MTLFKQVTIVGLGLIGGSLGMAIRRRRLARTVVGYGRRPSTLRRAQQARAIDVGTTNLRAAVRDADLIVLATPVDAIGPFATQAARSCRAGAIITDVGSTKVQIVRALERSLPKRIAFVGAHPIAGSEQQGIHAADPRLFEGTTCVLTPTARTHRGALRRVAQLWRHIGCRVVTMTPAAHDRLLAKTSHLPHVVAYTLARLIGAEDGAGVPRSFLDMTRVAKSDPGLWDDIFLSNRRELLKAMTRFERQWRLARRFLERADRVRLARWLARAHHRREAIKDSE